MSEKIALRGYIHNVSPVKKSARTPYFDMQIQTESDILRGVCFSAARQLEFQTLSEKKSPIKLSNVRRDPKPESTDILMNSNVSVEEIDPLNFDAKSQPSTTTIPSLSSVSNNQLLKLKATIVNISAPKRIKTVDGFKTKLDAVLLDPYGSIRIAIWEDFTKQIEEGKTYSFTNLRLKKNNGHDIYVTTAKTGCHINETEPFDQKLASPPELPDSLVTTTSVVDIVGINKFTTYYACTQCKKKLDAQDSHVVKCANCGLKQKLSFCSSHCYLQAIAICVDAEETTLTLTIFDDVIKDVLAAAGEPDTPLTEDSISDFFLTLPNVEITYHNKTKIVNSATLHH